MIGMQHQLHATQQVLPVQLVVSKVVADQHTAAHTFHLKDREVRAGAVVRQVVVILAGATDGKQLVVTVNDRAVVINDVHAVVRLLLAAEPVRGADHHPDSELARELLDLERALDECRPVEAFEALKFHAGIPGEAALREVNEVSSLGGSLRAGQQRRVRTGCVSARGVRRPVWDRRTSRICRLTSATLARTSAVMPNWHVASERRGPAVRPTSVWFVAPGFLAATASPNATTRPFFDSSPAAQWAVSRASRRNDGVSPRSISSPTSRWSASPPCRRRALLAPAVRLGVVVAANCDSEAVPVRARAAGRAAAGGRGSAASTLTLNFTRLGKLLQDLLIAILAMRISFVCIASAQLPGTGLRPSSPHAWRGT